MNPVRMCMVCRSRKEKQALFRVVSQKGQGVLIDTEGKAPGRGAYVCKSADCVKNARRRRVLERAFSREIPTEVYERLEAVFDES